MEYLILIAIVYLIYKVESKNTVKKDKNTSETLTRKSKVLITKEDFINEFQKRKEEREEFMGRNEYMDKCDSEKLDNIEKVFDNPKSKEKLIFHGGCLSCESSKKHEVGRCKGCQHFMADWSLPDLSIENVKQ